MTGVMLRFSTARAALVVASLSCCGPASASLAAADAAAKTHSNVPPKTVGVNIARASVGVLRVGVRASAYTAVWGIPDYIGRLESTTQVEMLWSRSLKATDAWGTATSKSGSSTVISEMRFSGPFKTVQGDVRGTTLTRFLRHWKSAGRSVAVYRNGTPVEYNVVVGAVIFAFDTTKHLRAVGLAVGTAGSSSSCVIPNVCNTVKIG